MYKTGLEVTSNTGLEKKTRSLMFYRVTIPKFIVRITRNKKRIPLGKCRFL